MTPVNAAEPVALPPRAPGARVLDLEGTPLRYMVPSAADVVDLSCHCSDTPEISTVFG